MFWQILSRFVLMYSSLSFRVSKWIWIRSRSCRTPWTVFQDGTKLFEICPRSTRLDLLHRADKMVPDMRWFDPTHRQDFSCPHSVQVSSNLFVPRASKETRTCATCSTINSLFSRVIKTRIFAKLRLRMVVFRFFFTLLLRILFTFPSQYFCAIGVFFDI